MRTEFEAARDWCIDLLAIAGVSRADAQLVADQLVGSDLRGYCRTG